MNPKADEMNPAMGRAIGKGRPPFNLRKIVVKAPMAKNPAWPIDIWPVYPTRIFKPMATMALMVMRLTI
jgi:hypothetical protein